ncbi:MAG: type II secretion system protein [Patescibacteria group bacterium]
MTLKNNHGLALSLSKGFTFIELVIIMGIMTLLMMIASVNLFPIKQKVSLSTTIQSLISDIKQQQIKSMSSGTNQGIYFDENNKNYTIFKGTTYLSSNPTNFNIPLGDQVVVSSIDFSGRQIILAPISGEIISFQPTANKIILRNTVSSEQRTIFFNKFGVITNVQ